MEGFKEIFMIMWNELFSMTIVLGDLSFSMGQLIIAGFAFSLIAEFVMHVFWGD